MVTNNSKSKNSIKNNNSNNNSLKNNSKKEKLGSLKNFENKLPKFRKKGTTFPQHLADKTSTFLGSWGFILIFIFLLVFWTLLNSYLLIFGKWDPYPFILLNLFLSCLAAIQAPIILMSQNRQSEVDRQRADYDYWVNRKAEREIKQLQLDIVELKHALVKKSVKKQKELKDEIKKIENELDKIEKKF